MQRELAAGNRAAALRWLRAPIAVSPPSRLIHSNTNAETYQAKVGGVFNIEPLSACAL